MRQKKILFRVDASLIIGTGHVMRCLTLAKALAAAGAKCYFACRELSGNLIEFIRQQGFEVSALPISKDQNPLVAEAEVLAVRHSAWLGCDWATDAAQTKNCAGETVNDWLVVDHYALDVRWESTMRNVATQIMVIDDLADRQHDCDVLLDQNYYLDMLTRYDGKVPEHCRLLLGPRYALLRDEFYKLHEQIKPRTGEVGRILVFFGGVDSDNYTSLAIEALAGLKIERVAVDVVIGAQHPCRSDIEKICTSLGYCCHVQTSHMAYLMAAADLAIGAGGSASWERCCLGVPALVVALAENQIGISKALDSIGACIYAGTKEMADSFTIQQTIANLLDKPDQLEVVSQRAFALVDGMGVVRTCLELGC